MKRILVLSGARSEFGLLEPVIEALQGRDTLEVRLAVTGVHLLEEFGHTVDEIRAGGYRVDHEIPMYDASDITDASLPGAIGRGVTGVSRAFRESESDILLVLGDRAEAMAGALAVYAAHGGVVHIHGGDRTDSGHIDEGFRHAITRFAHVHLAATETSATRLRAMGEEPWRVHRVGSPALDGARRAAERAGPELLDRYTLPVDVRRGIFLFHPDRLTRSQGGSIARLALDRMLDAGLAVLAVYPNSDPGSDAIIEAIDETRRRHPDRVTVRPSIPRGDFLALQAGAGVLVGNSSGGVIESAVLGLPVVNIGARNRDREHGANVLFVDPEATDIDAALRRALEDDDWLATCHERQSPYGDGQSGERIADVLEAVEMDERFFRKRMML